MIENEVKARGGGDVSYMLRDLSSIVRQLKKNNSSKELLDAGWVMAESIQACLRPPDPATLSPSQRRELRSHLLALQQIANSTSAPSYNEIEEENDSSSSSYSRADFKDCELEMEQQPRRQLVLQEEEDKSYDEELADMRERDIAQINTRVSTVNQIFGDIAGLVSNQQEEVDSIEAAVLTAHTRTNKGQQQLVRAEKRRTAKMKCCFYFAIFLAIFAVFLILAIIGFKNVAKVAY